MSAVCVNGGDCTFAPDDAFGDFNVDGVPAVSSGIIDSGLSPQNPTIVVGGFAPALINEDVPMSLPDDELPMNNGPDPTQLVAPPVEEIPTFEESAVGSKDVPHLSLDVSGEPDGPERVENLIKLNVVLCSLRDPSEPLPWSSVVIPSGLFSSPKGVFVRFDDLNAYSAMDKRFLMCRLHVVMDDISRPGHFVTVVACSKCVQREVKKLAAMITHSSSRSASKGIKNDKKQPVEMTEDFQKQLAEAFSTSMLTIHSEPEMCVTDGSTSFSLKLRLTCYSSHHEKQPFRVCLSLYDSKTQELVGQAMTKPITILDNHKNKSKKNSASQQDPAQAMKRMRPSESVASGSSTPVVNSGTMTPIGMAPSAVSSSNASSPLQFNSPVTLSQASSVYQPSAEVRVKSEMPGDRAGYYPMLDGAEAFNAQAQAMKMNKDGQQFPRLLTFCQIIPSSGSIGGGVPVTVLGRGFLPGDVLIFGKTPATDTKLWSEGTLLCTLPPSEHEGTVVVSIQGIDKQSLQGNQLFTYTDDTDMRLFTHAFRVLSSADNGHGDGKTSGLFQEPFDDPNASGMFHSVDPRELAADIIVSSNQEENIPEDLYELAKSLPEKRDKSQDENIIVKGFASYTSNPKTRNVDFLLKEPDTGRTLLHLAAMKGYADLGQFLVERNPNLLAMKDNLGFTALHLATFFSFSAFVTMLLSYYNDTNNSDVLDASELITTVSVSRAYRAAGIIIPSSPGKPTEDIDEVDRGDNLITTSVAVRDDSHTYVTYVEDVLTGFDVFDPPGAIPDYGAHDPMSSMDYLDSPSPRQIEELPQISGDITGEPPKKVYISGSSDHPTRMSMRGQQMLMFGIVMVIGAVMVTLIAANPLGFVHGDEPRIGASSGELGLNKTGQRNTLVLRILSSICFCAVAILSFFGLSRTPLKGRKAQAVVAGLISFVMVIYELIAIFAID